MVKVRQDRSRLAEKKALESALRIVRQSGFGGLAMATLSRESGISTGSLYHHFGSKNGLLTSLVFEFRDRATEQLDRLALDGLSFEDRLRAVLDLTCQQFIDNVELYRSATEIAKQTPEIWKPMRDLRANFEAVILREVSAHPQLQMLHDPKRNIQRMMQMVLGLLTHSVVFGSYPITVDDHTLKDEVFAIASTLLFLETNRGVLP